MESVPIIDLSKFLLDPTDPDAVAEAKKCAEALRQLGCLAVRDPRVTMEDNDKFMDLMERYFEQTDKQKKPDERPEYGYQVGVTPAHTEVPRCTLDPSCLERIKSLDEENKAHMPTGPDPKWRFFWHVGDRPAQTKFSKLNAAPVIPKAFPEWETLMNRWGSLMHAAVSSVTQMAAVGFDMPINTILDMSKCGPHLLAPTGSDLFKYGDIDTIFAGYHYDLNLLTIHGKSRYPGLYIWRRDGKKIAVRVPDGCLLVQAGKQFEWITGGAVEAGYHEVVVNQATREAMERNKAAGKSLWRISSTMFFHIASDSTLRPLTEFGFPNSEGKYPATLAGDQVAAELKAIKLMNLDGAGDE